MILLAPALMAQSQAPPVVPEGIHRTAEGPPRLCDSTAATIAKLEQKIVNDPSFREQNSNDRYRVLVREQDFVQFAFPRPGYLTFGMGTCIKVSTNGEGMTTIQRQMYCDGSRAQCDEIFVEWDRHDQAIQSSLGIDRD